MRELLGQFPFKHYVLTLCGHNLQTEVHNSKQRRTTSRKTVLKCTAMPNILKQTNQDKQVWHSHGKEISEDIPHKV
jgi:hypothetical protein